MRRRIEPRLFVQRSCWLAAAAILSGACGTPRDSPPEASAAPLWGADHHLHIQTAEAAAWFDRLGKYFDQESTAPAQERTAADAISALDAANIEKGIVLSAAYILGVPDLEYEGEREAVRRENLWAAEQAEQFPERLVALCSLNPLATYALQELELCLDDPRVAGLKLHLANSDVDLTDPEHLETLGVVFGRLERAGRGLLVHVRTRSEVYGKFQADAFIEVLSRTPDLTVQIAHMAGWGGYDDNTDAALGAFVEALKDGRLDPERVTFGLGAVVFLPEAAPDEETRAAVAAQNARLAERIREIGLGRVVYATDWPGWPPGVAPEESIAKNVELLRQALPLEPEELDQVLSNVGAMLDRTNGP